MSTPIIFNPNLRLLAFDDNTVATPHLLTIPDRLASPTNAKTIKLGWTLTGSGSWMVKLTVKTAADGHSLAEKTITTTDDFVELTIHKLKKDDYLLVELFNQQIPATPTMSMQMHYGNGTATSDLIAFRANSDQTQTIEQTLQTQSNQKEYVALEIGNYQTTTRAVWIDYYYANAFYKMSDLTASLAQGNTLADSLEQSTIFLFDDPIPVG
jgi:hypothetical protein